MQKQYLRLLAGKLPILMHRRIWPTLEICGSSGPPIPKVPRLHQFNVYIRRKLRVWGTQKCNFLVGAKTVPTVTGPQSTYSHAPRIWPTLEICGSSGPPIHKVPCLHQINVYIKRKLRLWGTQKCNFLVGAKTVPSVTDPQTTYSHAAPYKADIENVRQFWDCNPHGTVLAPNQCLYQKEATGVGNPKM